MNTRMLSDLASALRHLRNESDSAVAWRIGASLLLIVGSGLLSGIAPLALKGMIDVFSGKQSAGQPTTSVAALAVAYLMALGLGRGLAEIQPLLFGAAEQRLYARLRQRYFRHVLELPLAVHLEQQPGALVHHLQQAITGYQIVLFNLVYSIAPVVVELTTVSLVLLHLGQPRLTAAFAATALAYLCLVALPGFRISEKAREVSDASRNVQVVLTDGLLNVETLKCFDAQQTMTDRFERVNDVLERRWSLLHRERTAMGLAMTAAFALSMTISLWITILGTIEGTLGIGGFVLATVYVLQMTRPLETLGSASRDLAQALQFIRPWHDLMQATVEPSVEGFLPDRIEPETTAHGSTGGPSRSPAPPAHLGSPGAGIRFRGVHFHYGKGSPVLRGLDLAIAPGRTVAIVGASGSGKSSLARLMLRLHAPQLGCILIDDIPIRALPLGELRTMIGFVPQDIVLLNDSIAANISIGRKGAGRPEIEHAARIAGIHALATSLRGGYDTVVGERGLKLSGGERQRIAIARIVLKNPPFWLLDEATSMLDSLTERAVLCNLREAARGATMTIIAHRLSTIAHADEILVLEDGRVIERGLHLELLAHGGRYAQLWRAQQLG